MNQCARSRGRVKCSRLCLSRRGSPRNSGAWSSDSCCKQGLWPLLILLAYFHSQKVPVFLALELCLTREVCKGYLCLIYTYTYFILHRRPCQVWHIYSILGHLHIPTVPTGMVPYASFIITAIVLGAWVLLTGVAPKLPDD